MSRWTMKEDVAESREVKAPFIESRPLGPTFLMSCQMEGGYSCIWRLRS